MKHTPLTRRASLGLGAAAATTAALGVTGRPAVAASAGPSVPDDAALARWLPGDFRSARARVNGVTLHYVAGGRGVPLVLLGGWPQTWWQWHKVMPALAKRYRVIAVDYRGMGSSDKPQGGYDKKTMAGDVRELLRHLGHEQAHIVGHDIGAMVAESFAANHPEATHKVALLDVAHPDRGIYEMRMVPQPGQAPLPRTGYLWWFSFNQISGLPEQLLSGRARHLLDWLFAELLVDQAAIGRRERTIYAHAYNRPDAIRAGNGWYQAFGQDVLDQEAYRPITAPLLGLGGSHSGYGYLAAVLPGRGTDVRVVKVDNCGHFIPEERPEAVIRELTAFLG